MEVSTNRKIYWPIITAVAAITPVLFKLYWKSNKKTESDDLYQRQLQAALGNDSESETEELDVETEMTLASNTCVHCVGRITSVQNEDGLIDEKFYFKITANLSKKFRVGDKVSFVVYKLQDREIIQNVNLINDEVWEDCSKEESPTETFRIEKQAQILNRNFVGQVVNRHERYVLVSPPDLTCNLDEIQSDFIPIVGDWVVLETFAEVDESVSDLSGEILKVLKITPLRTKTKVGTIKFWNPLTQTGILDNDVFINKDCCEPGYIPAVHDTVVSQIIESNQDRCSWRSLSISPITCVERAPAESKDHTLDELVKDKCGITIQDHLIFDQMSINSKRCLKIAVNNVTNEYHKIFRCSFQSKRASSQLTLRSHKFDESVVLKPGQIIFYEIECNARFLGNSKEMFVFHFRGFKIGRWIEIQVNPHYENSLTGSTYAGKSNRNFGNLLKRISNTNNPDVFKGTRISRPPAFVPIKMGMYNLPAKLCEAVLDSGKNVDQTAFNVEKLYPVLKADLNFSNYNDRLAALLYLEEIQMNIHIHEYDMDRAHFIKNGEYLMLEILNLSERRPSLMLGDRLYASDPFQTTQARYEGYIHKILAKHICLKFSEAFHNSYVGQEYSIEFTLMRTTMRRCHQAVGLAIKHLGSNFLFPSGVTEQSTQFSTFDTINWCNDKLNHQQKQAVFNILKGVGRPLPYIIFGPPGTGKTVTVVETALQILKLIPGARLLVASPSNSSADLLATRLLESQILRPGDLVRLVSYRSVVEGLIPEHLLPYCATGEIAKEGSRHSREQNKDGIRLGCSTSVLGRHRITVGTCVSLGTLYNMGFARGHFTHVLVDEAGQATEPEVMIPLSLLEIKSGQVVLAGDPLQLGPVVLSNLAKQYGLEESLLVRLTARFPYERDWQGFPNSGGYDPRLITRLVLNYRSVPEILKLPSSLFYDSELIPTISQTDGPEASLLQLVSEDLPEREENGPPALVFHGVRGENFQQQDSPSWYNPHEAIQVFFYLNRLYSHGISAEQIGVITPYVKQVKEIRNLLIEKDLELPKISSVEEFQGQERPIIILSTVRSTTSLVSTDIKHFMGFISSPRRLNVALTRAQALLIIIGNPHILAIDPYWRNVLQYSIKKKAYIGCDLPTQYFEFHENEN